MDIRLFPAPDRSPPADAATRAHAKAAAERAGGIEVDRGGTSLRAFDTYAAGRFRRA